jgi:hypothetical protein
MCGSTRGVKAGQCLGPALSYYNPHAREKTRIRYLAGKYINEEMQKKSSRRLYLPLAVAVGSVQIEQTLSRGKRQNWCCIPLGTHR